MIRTTRSATMFVILIVFLQLLPTETFSASNTTIRDVLGDEIKRLRTRTLGNLDISGVSFLRRAVSDYREALGEFPEQPSANSESSGVDTSGEFSFLEDLVDRYASLAEKVHSREETIETLEDEFEQQKERAEETGFSLRTDWLNRYNERLDGARSLQRHHRLVIDLVGLRLARSLSNDPNYRVELLLDQMSRKFPDVLQETSSDDLRATHATRIYSELFEVVIGTLDESGLQNSNRTRFEDLIRKHGRLLRHLDRVGFDSPDSRTLLKKIQSRVNLNVEF